MRMFPKVGRGAGRFHARLDTTMFERATYADLLRGVQMGRYAGLYTVNEGRKLLGEQPYTLQQAESTDPGDKLWMPVNMAYVSSDVTGTSVDGGKGEGQGGNDQDGGDGGGKPASPTTQGGQRSDREIKHYLRLYKRPFRGALGRLSNKRKVNLEDYQKALGEILNPIASILSCSGESPDAMLDDAHSGFVADYIAGFYQRVKLNGNIDELAEDELRKAIQAIREHCQPNLSELDEPEPTEARAKAEVIELTIKPN